MVLLTYKWCKFLFRHVIPPPLRYPLGKFIGRLVWVFNGRRRRVIVANLTPLVGEKKAAKLAPALFGNFAMTAIDFFCARAPRSHELVFEGWSRIEGAYQASRRVMIVTAHIGSWEIGISHLVERGYPVAGLYATYTDDDIVEWILGHRHPQVHWIPTAPGAADISVAAIEQGRILCLAGDIPFGEHGRRLMVAGQPVHLPVGPWSIALRAKATVIPVFVLRSAPGRYRAIVHEPIKPGTGSLKQQMVRLQEIYRGHLEHYLKTYPEQWGNLQPFWDRS